MMRRMKKIILVFVAVILLLPSFLIPASTTANKSEEVDGDGNFTAKDEVVYATLTAQGEKQEIYVVNAFDVTKAGKMIDHGTYSSLKNLTDLTEIEQVGNKVQFTAEEGKYYYQGNLNEVALPWDISIFYYLDGKEISPEELAGKDGQVKIYIKTTANEKADSVFFENYVLQISLSFDTNLFTKLKAKDGMIANAGKNKQVTFTVMPQNEEELVVEADVVDFELDGIDITGVPSSFNIDTPDTDEMTGGMITLQDAIADINAGVGELKNGINEINNGVVALEDGSSKFNDGISELDEASTELVDGSKEMNQALEKLSSSLDDIGEIDVSEGKQLTDGLSSLSSGLREAASGLATLKKNYVDAYNALDDSIQAIPTYDMTEKEIQDLYKSGADPQIVDQLVQTYTAAQTAKGTYTQVKQAFDAVGTTLDGVISSLHEMADNVDTMVNELSSSLGDMDVSEGFAQFQEGIKLLSTNYHTFHTGLVAYTGGVSQLSNSYGELHNGIGELADGTKELENGATELHNGTMRLQQSTSDLPEQITKEIDQMIAEYDKSDFEAVSFVSTENGKVNSVQFVMKTGSIKSEESETTKEPVEEEKGFWVRLKELFS